MGAGKLAPAPCNFTVSEAPPPPVVPPHEMRLNPTIVPSPLPIQAIIFIRLSFSRSETNVLPDHATRSGENTVSFVGLDRHGTPMASFFVDYISRLND